jgi:outer membrane lipoprotein-sorting protein
MNDDEKYLEEFVKDLPFEDGNVRHRDALKARLLDAFPRQRLQPTDPTVPLWRTMMRTPIAKLAAAAAVVAVLWLGIHLTGHSNVAWADVMRSIQNARTLIYQTTLTFENGHRQVLKTMVRDPDRMRIELSDGRTWIADHSRGQTLLLDPNGTALSSTTPQQTLNVYEMFRNFRDLPDFSVRRIGRRMLDGAAAEGFELTKAGEEHPITVWADPQTSLPVRIEQTAKQADGKLIQVVTANIVFDTELNDSLFDLTVPAGYAGQRVDGPAERASKLELRMKSARKMTEILRTCLAYVQEHGGQWPDQLQDLARYGLSGDALVNPSRPDLKVGYVYRKPSTTASPQQVVLWEAYGSWSDGVNVGCADGHVEFIRDESVLKERIE